MSILKITKALTFAILLPFFSCQVEPIDSALLNQNSNNTTLPTTNGTFTAVIDGQSYVANDITAIKSTQTTSAGSVVSYTIVGKIQSSTNAKMISLQFFEHSSNNYVLTTNVPANSGMGQVSYIPDIINNSSVTYISTDTTNPFANQGAIAVSSNNTTTHKITGTFNANVFLQGLTTSVNITNGVFNNVEYTVQ